ncbi:hypothetical protein FB561_0352 [Kribbella amoyensis]|uniref:TPM domain-containing protein n=1 Tax=Kribbella amoyensis TaxID=996641 RepID=A0A561BKB8_9ACTN|nr:hypothetical protein [Kribbella amoyensis]TWD79295.1 hypothetical protein FB561_0352 [Kribbella amoyensis]
MKRSTRLLAVLALTALSAAPAVSAHAVTPTPTPRPTVDTPTPAKPSKTRPTYRYTPPDFAGDRKKKEAAAATYMNEVAAKLGEPGLYVDPKVTKLTASEISELTASAKAAAAPMRIAVIPASAIDTSLVGGYYPDLAWDGEEIADQLYDRVGVEGVYAVLVDASSEKAGRGFHAVQRADTGPTYYVGKGVDDAVDCCAPDYEEMLARFIQVAQVVDKPFYVDAAPWAGGAAGLAGLWWGVTALGARRARRADEKAHLEISRPLLTEEIIALSQQVSALPTTSDPQQSKLSKDVLDTVEKARHRLDKAEGDKDTEAVATLLGSARYGLLCLDALRAGKPVPEPTPPCFFDPRHGPSTSSASWAPPEGGKQRSVEVCVECAARLAADQEPDVRMVTLRNHPRPYWTLGEELASYIDGYWSQGDGRSWRFPDDDARRAGEQMRSRWRSRRPGARFSRFTSDVGTSVSSWSASRGDDNDSVWSSGSSRSRSWSSRTRSSSGGSSRRSSRRSGGSRGF